VAWRSVIPRTIAHGLIVPIFAISRCFFGDRIFQRNHDKKVRATPQELFMPDTNQAAPRSGFWTQILTDAHFWVPAIVLLVGLLVLHWIR